MATLNNSRILVVAAVRQELAAFRPGDERVLCRLTGMGARAGAAVDRLLARGRYDCVISAGFAGGLRPETRAGDLVVASEVIEASSGTVVRPVSSGTRLGGLAQRGPFVTVDRVLPGSLKSEMGKRFGAIAVDMETSLVARAAGRAGVPWMGLRAILDPVEVSIPVSSGFQALSLAAQPWRWGELTELIGSVRMAGESLGLGLRVLVEEITSPN